MNLNIYKSLKAQIHNRRVKASKKERQATRTLLLKNGYKPEDTGLDKLAGVITDIYSHHNLLVEITVRTIVKEI